MDLSLDFNILLMLKISYSYDEIVPMIILKFHDSLKEAPFMLTQVLPKCHVPQVN